MSRTWGRVLLALCLLCCAVGARAQSCSGSAVNINFGNVSPISGAAVPASSTVSVTCTWPAITLTPSVLVCLNLAAASPRSMSNGSNTLQYDLYQDSAHSQIWGSTTTGTTPISFILNEPVGGTSASNTVTFYGLIAAGQPTVPSVGNSSTVYSQTFSGGQTLLNYGFFLLLAPTCGSLGASGMTFPFVASATVVNNCNISASNLNFGPASLLTSGLTATSSVSVACTNGDAYLISLNGGGSGNVAARSMARQGGGGSVGYQLYLDPAHSTPWGDGTSGTSRASGTGTGLTQAVTVYGQVPAQTTPMPGNYSDTITATIVF